MEENNLMQFNIILMLHNASGNIADWLIALLPHSEKVTVWALHAPRLQGFASSIRVSENSNVPRGSVKLNLIIILEKL